LSFLYSFNALRLWKKCACFLTIILWLFSVHARLGSSQLRLFKDMPLSRYDLAVARWFSSNLMSSDIISCVLTGAKPGISGDKYFLYTDTHVLWGPGKPQYFFERLFLIPRSFTGQFSLRDIYFNNAGCICVSLPLSSDVELRSTDFEWLGDLLSLLPLIMLWDFKL